MKKLFVILILVTLSASAQDTLYWQGAGHKQYVVQKGLDTTVWINYAVVPGTADTNYKVHIPGPTYYYRVYADADTSPWLLAFETLGITPDSVVHPQHKAVSFDFKAWQSGSVIELQITSTRYQQATIRIAGILGDVIEQKAVTLTEGSNAFSMPAPVAGIYAVSVQTYFDFLTKKIFSNGR